MERSREMDLAGCSSNRALILNPARRLAVVIFLSLGVAAQQNSDALSGKAKDLAARQHWREIVGLVEPVANRSANLDFYYADALAHLGKLQEAKRVFEEGHHLQPHDSRFLVELAGISFKEKNYSTAVVDLRNALILSPNDPYALNFLGTLYFLEGNLEAALKYWNRIQKPMLREVSSEPTPQLDPGFFDRAFAFSPASVLRLPDFLTTEAEIEQLDIFPAYGFELQAQPDGQFDVVFHNTEQDGCGFSKWECLLLAFQGLPEQMVSPKYFNFGHKDVNVSGLYRWDAQKRRIHGEISGPLENQPKWRYSLEGDYRDENWDIRHSFTGVAPVLASFKLLREGASANLRRIVNGRFKWYAAADFSHRDFRNTLAGLVLTPNLLAQGSELKERAGIDADLWHAPDRRMDLTAGGEEEMGRVWSQPADSFTKLQSSAKFRWFPQQVGDDYEIREQVHAGKSFGNVPFDELYVAGVLGNADLLMRGHIATRDGRNGSSPIGSNYFVSNFDFDKMAFQRAGLRARIGPFLDSGTLSGPTPGLGSHEWLFDTGVQAEAKFFGVGVALSYGRDLRSGNNGVTLRLQ